MASRILSYFTTTAMSDGRKSSKLYIPHTEDEGCNIVGVLEQLGGGGGGDTQGRPIALVRSSSHCFSRCCD